MGRPRASFLSLDQADGLDLVRGQRHRDRHPGPDRLSGRTLDQIALAGFDFPGKLDLGFGLLAVDLVEPEDEAPLGVAHFLLYRGQDDVRRPDLDERVDLRQISAVNERRPRDQGIAEFQAFSRHRRALPVPAVGQDRVEELLAAAVCFGVGVGGSVDDGHAHDGVLDVKAVLRIVEKRRSVLTRPVRDIDPAQGRHFRTVDGTGDRAAGDLEPGGRRLDGEREGRLDHDVPFAPIQAHPAIEPRQAPIERQVLHEGRVAEARFDPEDDPHRAALDELDGRAVLSGPAGESLEAQLPGRHLFGLVDDRFEDVPGTGQDFAPGRLVVEALDPAGLRVEADFEEVVFDLVRAGLYALWAGSLCLRRDDAIEPVACLLYTSDAAD